MLLGDWPNEILAEVTRLSSPATVAKMAATCKLLLTAKEGGDLNRYAPTVKLLCDQLFAVNGELNDLMTRVSTLKKGVVVSVQTAMKVKSSLKTAVMAVNAANTATVQKHLLALLDRDLTNAAAFQKQVRNLDVPLRMVKKNLAALEEKIRDLGA